MRIVGLNLIVLCAAVTSAAAQVPPATTARVLGYVYTANNAVVADAQVQLRDTVGGSVAAITRSNATGEYAFAVTPGSYVVELVNAAGGLTAVGHPFTVAAGETVATFVRIASWLPGLIVPSRWELGAGVVGSWRDRSRGGAPGGGVLFGYHFGGAALVAEVSGVRRVGHNDWRAVGGLRVGLVEGSRAVLVAHAMGGSLIRNGRYGLALAAGLGAEVRGTNHAAFRLQAEVTRDTADGRRATGVRASAWVVVR